MSHDRVSAPHPYPARASGLSRIRPLPSNDEVSRRDDHTDSFDGEPNILTAIIKSWSTLIKQRPSTMHSIVSSLNLWTPVSPAGLPTSAIKSAENGIRILLVHRSSWFGLRWPINEAPAVQVQRMERAPAEEKARKQLSQLQRPRQHANTSLHLFLQEEQTDPKRLKAEVNNAGVNSAKFLAAFDFTTLPIGFVMDLIVANLQAFLEPALMNLVQSYQQSRGLPSVLPAKPPQTPDSIVRTEGTSVSETLAGAEAVKEEAVDQLEMGYDPDKSNLEVSLWFPLWSESPDPAFVIKLSGEEAATCEEMISLNISDDLPFVLFNFKPLGPAAYDFHRQSSDLFFTRMIIKVVMIPGASESPKDDDKASNVAETQLTALLCLAITWMNEEWRTTGYEVPLTPIGPSYELWLNQIISTYRTVLEGKADGKSDSRDKAFWRFLLDLPDVPGNVLDILCDLCAEDARGLHDASRLVLEWPSLRAKALRVLLDLTTHPDSVARRAATNTVRQWVQA
ncbi:hypothetical protein F5J12DRAFT_786122 [Pisolithus orientalis]|uniref:uncharacterized protein n=1 Tax=Pisolithus orientalis TaxID=936130 RepID=UPI0022259655|nr:uncharacterized protein F5J12DRAFT_786122 [Pisolithus orientalis]KAI5992596.1 hypothetical protein F5J12DRAFT_786122 [Pisolithus orientalis]